jgi:hypothetical protein
MAPAPNGVATGLTLDLVFVDACRAAVGGSDRCWPIVQSWRNACYGAWALRRFLKPCACTGGPSTRSAWRMSMGWPVWNWGASWMGRTDRCAVLRNPNGVVSSEHLEGIAAVVGISGYPSIGFGTVGSGRCSVYEVNDGTGQVDHDPLTRCLFANAHPVWVERDKLNLHMIYRIRSFP